MHTDRLNRICKTLLNRVGLSSWWSIEKGPSDKAWGQAQAGASKVDREQRVMLMLAFAVFNDRTTASFTDVMHYLQPDNIRSVASLLMAHADGGLMGSAVSEWLEREAKADDALAAWQNKVALQQLPSVVKDQCSHGVVRTTTRGCIVCDAAV